MQRKSTIMDQQGRIFLPRDIVKAMRLTAKSEIEWFINDDGDAAFRPTHGKKKI